MIIDILKKFSFSELWPEAQPQIKIYNNKQYLISKQKIINNEALRRLRSRKLTSSMVSIKLSITTIQ